MSRHTELTMARVVQHLLRFPSSLSHRVLVRFGRACWGAGYAAGLKANAQAVRTGPVLTLSPSDYRVA
jgi:hypothetical protein